MLHIEGNGAIKGLAITASVLAALAAASSRRAMAQPPNSNPSAAPCSTVFCDVQNDWLRNNGMLGLTANAMPADKFNFKPTPAQQTFGERVLHAAIVDVELLKTLGGKTPAPTIDKDATSKAASLAELKKASDYGTALLKEFGATGINERVASPPFMGPMSSRQRIFYFLMEHTQNVYGQLVVSLRLNGIVPPLSREP